MRSNGGSKKSPIPMAGTVGVLLLTSASVNVTDFETRVLVDDEPAIGPAIARMSIGER